MEYFGPVDYSFVRIHFLISLSFIYIQCLLHVSLEELIKPFNFYIFQTTFEQIAHFLCFSVKLKTDETNFNNTCTCSSLFQQNWMQHFLDFQVEQQILVKKIGTSKLFLATDHWRLLNEKFQFFRWKIVCLWQSWLREKNNLKMNFWIQH